MAKMVNAFSQLFLRPIQDTRKDQIHDGQCPSEGREGVSGSLFASQTVQMSVTSVNQWILHCTSVLYR